MTGQRKLLSLVLATAVAATALAAANPLAAAAPPTTTPPGVGQFEQDNATGLISGDFVSFFAPASGAVLSSYVSENVTFFDSIDVTGYLQENVTFMGSLATIEGNNAAATAHDNPSSILKVTLEANSSATFDLAAGATASWGTNGSVAVAVSGSNRTARIWTTCGENNTSIGDGNSSVSVDAPRDCHVFFRSHVLDPSVEAAVSQAAEARMLAAEVYVGRGRYAGADVSVYGDADVAVSAQGDRVVLVIDSPSNTPSSIVVRFAAKHPGSPSVLFDGRGLQQARDIDDALDPNDDNGAVEYSFTEYDGTGLLVVSIPAPASHILEIEPAVAAPTSTSPLWGIAVGLGVTAAAAALLFRRR